MSIRRFHCDALPPAAPAFVTLDRQQAEHARKSLRLSAGDTIELFDGSGSTALALITELSRSLVAEIQSIRITPPLHPVLTLAVAIPKGSRADTLIDQATQLGVSHLIPLITQRSVVEPRDSKIDRFHRIVIEACKQSHRPHFMTIAPPTALPDLLAQSPSHDTRLIADLPQAVDLQVNGSPSPSNQLAATPPSAQAVDLQVNGSPPPSSATSPHPHLPTADVQSLHTPSSPADLRTTLHNARRVLVLVGPEGGWTDDERAASQNAGFLPLCLAPYILRVETAALAAAALIRQSS